MALNQAHKSALKGAAAKSAQSKSKKSGIKSFKPGEVVFKENDPASSLYIIQTGQIRLYRPKGRGFVELAILRSGEVIGEMAYFDEKNRRRSCSAMAIVTTEVVEISFVAFAKTMQNLNPWFRTIINTLSDRLRKTNEKVKQLEANSVSSGSGSDYKFFQSVDIIRAFSQSYLAFTTHGVKEGALIQLHKNKLRFYLVDVFNYPEVKFEEVMMLMRDNDVINIVEGDDGKANILTIDHPDRLRDLAVFFNAERSAADDKKIQISSKCQILLGMILNQAREAGLVGDKEVIDFSKIMDEVKSQDLPVTEEAIKDAVDQGIVEDIVVGEGNKLTCEANIKKISKLYPAIKIMNAVKAINEKKSG